MPGRTRLVAAARAGHMTILEAATNASPEPMKWRRRMCFSSQVEVYTIGR
jgi:hypothetical protein